MFKWFKKKETKPPASYEETLELLKNEFPSYVKDNIENMKVMAYEISKGCLSLEVAKSFIKSELKFLGEN